MISIVRVWPHSLDRDCLDGPVTWPWGVQNLAVPIFIKCDVKRTKRDCPGRRYNSYTGRDSRFLPLMLFDNHFRCAAPFGALANLLDSQSKVQNLLNVVS